MRRRPRPALSTLALLLALGMLGAFVLSGGTDRLNLADWAERAASRGAEREAAERAAERYGPEDLYLFERTIGGSTVPSAAVRERAGEQAATLLAKSKKKGKKPPKFTKKRWRGLGPTNIGARVTDMVTDVALPDTLWIAAATGGVWVSRDAGVTFQYAWDYRLPQSIGAIAQAPDGTLYVGTGETNPGGGSLTYGGDGVYKSTDRGQTWTNVGLRNSSTIGRIVVHPGDSRHVYVAVSGDLFAPGGERGLYETRDGGATWSRILAPPNETTGAADVAVDPENPNNILVAMWDKIRYPDVRYYTGDGSGIWRSTDGGASFTRLGPANGLLPAAENVGRIGVTFDPQSDRAYAIYANNEIGAFQAWFVSVNNGQTWTAPPGNAGLAASQSVYGWWFARVWVDPRDSNHVFIAGLMLYESVNSGISFAPDTSQHVDQHAMAWDPRVENRVYSGNDGGVYRSDENGANNTWVLAKHMPWNQFFTVDVSETNPSRINGGVQDNGSLRSWGYELEEGEQQPTPESAWDQYNGGDGVENAIHPQNENIVFACSQYGACVRSENGGDDNEGMDNSSERFGWYTPIEFQPGNPQRMYWAGSEVNKSEDTGQSWESTSPDLGKGEGGREINPLYANHYGTVQALGLSRTNPDIIYAGTDNGYLWKSTDTGASWTELTPSQALPDSWVTHIEVHPKNPDIVYLTYGGYHGGDETPYVFVSKDGGKTWANISGRLPQAPVLDLVLVRGWRFVATDVGVFVAGKRRPKRWFVHGRNLPNVPINDLRYVPTNKTLYAATFGHGIQAISIPKKKPKKNAGGKGGDGKKQDGKRKG